MTGNTALRRRRRELEARSAAQRLELAMHVQDIEDSLAPLDRGVGVLRQVARPAALLGAGIMLTLVLGRRRMRGLLGGGIALAGIAFRWRRTAKLLRGLLAGVPGPLRSSGDRGGAAPGTSASTTRTR